MSSDTVELTLNNRDITGKKVKSLRKDGDIPAVIHNHGKDSLIVSGQFTELAKAYNKAGKHQPVALTVDGKNYLAIIKDVDIDPKKNRLRHVVFGAIKQNEKVETEVPVKLIGEIPAERANLLVLTQNETIAVAGLPKDLIDEIEVDASTLAEVGDKITVADIAAPKGIEIVTEPETVLATVEMPKDQVAEADAAAAEMAEANEADVPSEQGDASPEGEEQEES